MVSVVVTTYNHNEFIKLCLDSILMQATTFPFEIILGEDESTDRTREICKEYAAKYPEKIKLFLRSRKDVIYISGNPTGRFNFIENLKACKGKYIALCEGDDYWTDPLKLQKQVDFLEANPDYGICFHPIKVYDQFNQDLIEDIITRKVCETTDIKELAKGNFIHTPSIMLRNDFTIPAWFVASPIGDWTLYMIAIKNKKIKKLNDFMAVYRLHSNSIWSQKTTEYRILNTMKSVKLLIDSKEMTPQIKSSLALLIRDLKNKIPKKPNNFSIILNKIKSKINKYFF
jgi:glycosyltransferase involved in cell wall biosynthesis